jgi:hypothetical protein
MGWKHLPVERCYHGIYNGISESWTNKSRTDIKTFTAAGSIIARKEINDSKTGIPEQFINAIRVLGIQGF